MFAIKCGKATTSLGKAVIIGNANIICRRQTSFKKVTFVLVDKGDFFVGGGGWIRTTEVERQQIYSLPPLAARELLHIAGAGNRT